MEVFGSGHAGKPEVCALFKTINLGRDPLKDRFLLLERTGGLELDVFEKTLTEANSGHPISYFVIEDSKERKEYIWLYTSLFPKTRGALHQLFEIYVRCFGFEGTIGYEGYYSDNDMLLEESQRRGESDL